MSESLDPKPCCVGPLFLAGFCLLLCACGRPGALPYPIIDGHMHIYDTTRPQGVPWPTPKEAVIYRPFLPAEYRDLAERNGIGSAVVVITGEWEADNAWNLDRIRDQADLFPAYIGNLYLDVEPAAFRARLDSLLAEPQFRGIRAVHKSADKQLSDRMMANIRYLAERGGVLEILCIFYSTDDIVRIAEANPGLTIVLSGYGAEADEMRKLGPHRNVIMKVGGDLSGTAWQTFGEDRLIFGTNWPTLFLYTENMAAQVDGAIESLAPRRAAAQRKVMRENAARVYGLDLKE